MSNSPQSQLASRTFGRAIDAFKSENYHRVIHFLDQALQTLPDESTSMLKINILDSRAAAKQKLNDLKGGLADAKLVIDLAPDCPKGYIRAARLFQRIGRFSSSIKMFERAMTKLSSDPKKNLSTIELLQAELKQARVQDLNCRNAARSLSASSKIPKRDISAILPFELFIIIIALLDQSTRLRCMGVCRSWRSGILNTPNLWTSLSLTAPNHHKMTTKAKFWISRLGSNHHLKTLSIKVCPTWPPSTTHDLLTMLSAKSPTLITSHSPKAGLQSFSFHVGGVSHAIGELQRILNEVLAFAHLNRMNLATFELKLPAFITFPLPLHVFLSMFPLLKELKLQGERGQLLSLMQSEDFFRTSFSTSQTTHGVSSFSGNDSHNSSLAQSVSVGSTGTDQHGICLDSGLETLFLQCASFIPSTDGPLKVASLRSVSLISTIFNNGRAQSANSNQYVPEIDFTCLQWLENLELSRVASGQQQWEPIWRSCERLPRLKRLRLEGLPHFIPHFLDLANVPEDWSPRDHVDQPFRANTKNILPQIECLCLSSIDSLMCYKFLAIFGCQFLQLDSLSVVGLSLDSTTEPFLINALRHLPPLVNLNLSNTHASSDLIDAIKPDRLQHLQLTNCTRVTFRSLARLMSHRLTLLDITGCQLISTREMIEWLAQRVDCLVWQAGQTSNGKAAKRLFLD